MSNKPLAYLHASEVICQMPLNLRQFEILNAVLQAGSMSAAARKLRISQPAVSRSIAATEQQLGVKLFTREGSAPTPTDELAELGIVLDPIFRQIEAAQNVASLLRFGAGRSLRLAVSPAFAFAFLPRACARFRERFPHAKLVVRIRDASAVKAGIGQREYDLGLVYNETWGGHFESVDLCQSEIVCILPDGHPLTSKDVVTPGDLEGQPLISFGHTASIGQDLDRMFEAEGIKRDLSIAIGNSISAAAFVREGAGIAISDPFLLGTVSASGLVVRPFRPRRPLVPRVIYPEGRSLSDPESYMIQCLVDAARSWDQYAMIGGSGSERTHSISEQS
jgi:DNA-binding transcriptional LysR family regulator